MTGSGYTGRRRSTLSDKQLNVLVTARRKQLCERHALHLVATLAAAAAVPGHWLLRQLGFLTRSHYDDITEERALDGRCGYLLCERRLFADQSVLARHRWHTRRYTISTRTNRVYDIGERKRFCCSRCFRASRHLQRQMLTSPLWLREPDCTVHYQLLDDVHNRSGVAGDVVQFSVRLPPDEAQSGSTGHGVSDANCQTKDPVLDDAGAVSTEQMISFIVDNYDALESQISELSLDPTAERFESSDNDTQSARLAHKMSADKSSLSHTDNSVGTGFPIADIGVSSADSEIGVGKSTVRNTDNNNGSTVQTADDKLATETADDSLVLTVRMEKSDPNATGVRLKVKTNSNGTELSADTLVKTSPTQKTHSDFESGDGAVGKEELCSRDSESETLTVSPSVADLPASKPSTLSEIKSPNHSSLASNSIATGKSFETRHSSAARHVAITSALSQIVDRLQEWFCSDTADKTVSVESSGGHSDSKSTRCVDHHADQLAVAAVNQSSIADSVSASNSCCGNTASQFPSADISQRRAESTEVHSQSAVDSAQTGCDSQSLLNGAVQNSSLLNSPDCQNVSESVDRQQMTADNQLMMRFLCGKRVRFENSGVAEERTSVEHTQSGEQLVDPGLPKTDCVRLSGCVTESGSGLCASDRQNSADQTAGGRDVDPVQLVPHVDSLDADRVRRRVFCRQLERCLAPVLPVLFGSPSVAAQVAAALRQLTAYMRLTATNVVLPARLHTLTVLSLLRLWLQCERNYAEPMQSTAERGRGRPSVLTDDQRNRALVCTRRQLEAFGLDVKLLDATISDIVSRRTDLTQSLQ